MSSPMAGPCRPGALRDEQDQTASPPVPYFGTFLETNIRLYFSR